MTDLFDINPPELNGTEVIIQIQAYVEPTLQIVGVSNVWHVCGLVAPITDTIPTHSYV